MDTAHGLALALLLGGSVALMACHERERPTEPGPKSSPTAVAAPPVDAGSTRGLIPSADGRTVYDVAQRVTWLADANLAADPAIRGAMGVPGIDPSGAMDYPTAIAWVKALNDYDGRAGYLGHPDWQLPTTPSRDDSCAIPHGRSGNAFGPSCTDSALGGLYSRGFGRTYPGPIVPARDHHVGPLVRLQQGLYWAGGEDDRRPATAEDSPNAYTFTFTTGAKNRKTTEANYFYVLPMVPGHIGPRAPTGEGVVAYGAGPAKDLAVYDTVAKVTWLRDGALAASPQGRFGVDGNVSISFNQPRAPTLSAPAIDASGAMQFATAHQWLRRLNKRAYAGSAQWALPTVEQLQGLREHLGSAVAERLLERGPAGPFANLQIFFYWSCERGPGDSRSPCDDTLGPGRAPGDAVDMRWAYDFQSGFQGTDQATKRYFVMVYYPHE